MKQLSKLFFLAGGLLWGSGVFAQDTLPKFSVKNAGGNRIIIGWVNPFPDMRQISIQRSFDSLKDYKTILSVADPKAVQNGYVDMLAANDHMYYRIFYVAGNGSFFFSGAKKPTMDTTRVVATAAASNGYPASTQMPATGVPANQVVKKPDFIPSFYVYSKNDGNVFINLPDADKKDYHVKFFEENGTPLFEIKSIKETGLTLDKANFYHAGWFKFELYNDEKLVEKHRFYIGKNF